MARRPKCDACNEDLSPLGCFQCATCGALLCLGTESAPWTCFLRHCEKEGTDDVHRGKHAEVRSLYGMSTPCLHCREPIRAYIRFREEQCFAFRAVGAIWDRGWFCGDACRQAFNLYAPADGWDRAMQGLAPKSKGN